MKKLSRFKNITDSVIVMVLLVFFSYVMCNLLLVLVREIIIPSIALFSYDFHRYLEQIEHDVKYEGVQQMIALSVWRASAIPALFLAAPLAVRLSPFRSRYFKTVTEARVDYAEGMRMYIREHAVYDVAVAAVATFALCFLFPLGRLMYPVGLVVVSVPTFLVWLLMLSLTVLALPVGVFYAQKRWRARYICSTLD